MDQDVDLEWNFQRLIICQILLVCFVQTVLKKNHYVCLALKKRRFEDEKLN